MLAIDEAPVTARLELRILEQVGGNAHHAGGDAVPLQHAHRSIRIVPRSPAGNRLLDAILLLPSAGTVIERSVGGEVIAADGAAQAGPHRITAHRDLDPAVRLAAAAEDAVRHHPGMP